MEKVKYKNVNEYIKGFPKNVKELLKQIRTTIKEIVPEAEESISYGMPAYKLKGKPVGRCCFILKQRVSALFLKSYSKNG